MSYTDNEKELALNLLRRPDLIDIFLNFCHRRYIGRDKELVLVKLATVSRHFQRGIFVIITGASSVKLVWGLT